MYNYKWHQITWYQYIIIFCLISTFSSYSYMSLIGSIMLRYCHLHIGLNPLWNSFKDSWGVTSDWWTVTQHHFLSCNGGSVWCICESSATTETLSRTPLFFPISIRTKIWVENYYAALIYHHSCYTNDIDRPSFLLHLRHHQTASNQCLLKV